MCWLVDKNKWTLNQDRAAIPLYSLTYKVVNLLLPLLQMQEFNQTQRWDHSLTELFITSDMFLFTSLCLWMYRHFILNTDCWTSIGFVQWTIIKRHKSKNYFFSLHKVEEVTENTHLILLCSLLDAISFFFPLCSDIWDYIESSCFQLSCTCSSQDRFE